MAFFNRSSELPEIDVQIGTIASKKGQWRSLFDINGTSGNTEAALLFERQRTLSSTPPHEIHCRRP